MSVDDVLHPALEVGSDQEVDVTLLELLGVDLVFEGQLDLGVGHFDQISLNRKRNGVEPEVLSLVEDRVDVDQLASALLLQELML